LHQRNAVLLVNVGCYTYFLLLLIIELFVQQESNILRVVKND